MKISIVIPAHNEENRIGKTLDIYSDYFEKLRKNETADYKILVVINNTRDKTENIIKKIIKKNKNIGYLNFKKGGKGFAIVQGFKYALKGNSQFIGFVDADMATPPDSFFDLVRNINHYDGVIASRWMRDSKIDTPQTILRKITSRGFNFLVKTILLLPYSDTQCGAKLFRRKAISSVISDLGTTEWAFDIDLLYRLKKKGFKIKEIPTIWNDKKGSKLNLKKVPFKMFSSIIRLRLIYSPFKFIVKIYDKLPERIKVHSW